MFFIDSFRSSLKIFCLFCFFSRNKQSFAFVLRPATRTSSIPRLDAIKVGFIGFGTIAASIATGLATQHDIQIESISISRRSEAKSQAIKEAFPDLVTVHDDNQEILDRSDLIFLCVLPQQCSQVLQDLSFNDSKHTLVSLVVSSDGEHSISKCRSQ